MRNVDNNTVANYNMAFKVVSLANRQPDDDGIPTLGYPLSKGEGEGGFDFSQILALFGTGGIGGILSSIFGNIFQEGWSISCIGAQAYNKQDFEREMNEAKAITQATNPMSIASLDNLVNQMSWRVSLDELIANSYRSSCSKNLRLKRRDYCKNTLDTVLEKVIYTGTPEQATGENNYTWIRYRVTGIKQDFVIPPTDGGTGSNPNNGGITGGSGPIVGGEDPFFPYPDMTGGFNPNDYFDQSQGLMNAFQGLPLPDQVLLQSYASNNGKSLDEILKGYFSGQIRIVNGRVIWGVSAGSQNQDPMFTYLMYGGIGYLIYRFVKK